MLFIDITVDTNDISSLGNKKLKSVSNVDGLIKSNIGTLFFRNIASGDVPKFIPSFASFSNSSLGITVFTTLMISKYLSNSKVLFFNLLN